MLSDLASAKACGMIRDGFQGLRAPDHPDVVTGVLHNRAAHVVTLWFTPDHPPVVEFKTIGDIAVDSKGVWSPVVGAVGTAFATSPEDLAQSQATSQGTRDLGACTGLRRVQFGRPPKGEMGAAGIGATWRVPAEIQPGGVMIIGPQHAEVGMTFKADVSSMESGAAFRAD